MAWTLCTKEDVMAIHPIAESSLKDEWSTNVEGLIKQHIGAPNLGTPISVTETHNGDGTNLLVVNSPPIVAVTALSVEGVALTSSDYTVSSNTVQLKALKFTEGTLNVSITYTSGTQPNVDPVIRFAAATMIVAIINYRGRYGADSSITWGMDDVKKGERTPNVNVGLVRHLKAIMETFLRREKVRIG